METKIVSVRREQETFTGGFFAEKCIQCGKCLAGCQYRKITPKQARDLMKKITAKPQWYTELDSCIRCGKCDHRCPHDARPSDLMRECLQHKRRAERRVPSSMAHGINGMGAEGWKTSFFKDAYKSLGTPDKNILRDWAVPKKSKDILFIGCTDRMSPRAVEESSILRSLGKFGGPDDCCGVWAIQGGLLDEGYRIAKRLVDRVRENRFERLVVGCGHCQKVLTRIFPDTLGIKLPFPVISIYEYFLDRIETGAVRVKNPAHLEAAVSDPCFGYENGKDYLDAIRRLAQTIGMSVSEMPHNRENALCCGYGGLYNDGKIANIARAAMIKRKDMVASGKKNILSYCPGCHLVNHYFQPGYKSHYLLEDVLSSLGDPVTAPFSIFYRRVARPHMLWNLTKVSKSALF